MCWRCFTNDVRPDSSFGDDDVLLESAKVHAWECLRVEARLRAVYEVERHGVFNVVNRFHEWAAKPQTDEIFAWSEEYLAQKERGSSGLAGPQADEFTLLGCICVNDAIAIGIIEDNGEVRRRKIRVALEFEAHGQIAACERHVYGLAEGIR